MRKKCSSSRKKSPFSFLSRTLTNMDSFLTLPFPSLSLPFSLSSSPPSSSFPLSPPPCDHCINPLFFTFVSPPRPPCRATTAPSGCSWAATAACSTSRRPRESTSPPSSFASRTRCCSTTRRSKVRAGTFYAFV